MGDNRLMQREILRSSVSWLDFAEDDCRTMMEVVSLFKLRETRDELGVGSIRNAFSDLLFPGTSTLQPLAQHFNVNPCLRIATLLNRKRLRGRPQIGYEMMRNS
jgi:hypothetical protein